MIRTGLTDEQLATIDVVSAIRSGLEAPDAYRRLTAEVAVAAAIQADRAGADPKALAFLAETVRRGGFGCLRGASELMPTETQSALVGGWLAAAGESGEEERFARWLDAVAMILGLRRISGR